MLKNKVLESNKIYKKELQQKINLLKKKIYLLRLFEKKFFEHNNQIIRYLNFKDFNPKYINLEDLNVDEEILKKSLKIESQYFEMFEIQDYMEDPFYSNTLDNSINIDPQFLKHLDIAEKQLMDFNRFLDYLIETKNFYYKYKMFKCLVENHKFHIDLLAQISSYSEQILEYNYEFLKLLNIEKTEIFNIYNSILTITPTPTPTPTPTSVSNFVSLKFKVVVEFIKKWF
jgi:hypothetical protein